MRAVSRLAAGLAAASLAAALAPAAFALPAPEPPHAGSPPANVPSPSPAAGALLPFGSAIFFVLDEPLASGRAKTGDVVQMHLRDALVVNGITLAPAGTPGTLSVVNVHRAASGDNNGSLQISIQPLVLPNYGSLPVRANHEYLTIERSSGSSATQGVVDTVTDIFIPGAYLYNALRKGRDFTLPRGAELRALTGATIDASNPLAVTILPPPPLVTNYDAPHADYTASPVYTPVPPPPKRTPTPKPTPVPTVTPLPDVTPSQ